MYVCGKYLMEQGRLADNTIVTTIMSNLGLYKACDKIGMKYEQTAVGDKYVYENMLKMDMFSVASSPVTLFSASMHVPVMVS